MKFLWSKIEVDQNKLLLVQQVLADPKHLQQMKKEDLRALTLLTYSHVTPYRLFKLDLSERMQIEMENASA